MATGTGAGGTRRGGGGGGGGGSYTRRGAGRDLIAPLSPSNTSSPHTHLPIVRTELVAAGIRPVFAPPPPSRYAEGCSLPSKRGEGATAGVGRMDG